MSKDPAQLLELKRLIKEALQQKGVLAQIKADVRASVYTVIQQQEGKRDEVYREKGSKKNFMKDRDNRIASELFIDFLQQHDFGRTLSVFLAELDMQASDIPGRDKVAFDIGISAEGDPDQPLINKLLMKGNPHDPYQGVSLGISCDGYIPPSPTGLSPIEESSYLADSGLKVPTRANLGIVAPPKINAKETSNSHSPTEKNAKLPESSSLNSLGLTTSGSGKSLPPITGLKTPSVSLFPRTGLSAKPLSPTSPKAPSNHESSPEDSVEEDIEQSSTLSADELDAAEENISVASAEDESDQDESLLKTLEHSIDDDSFQTKPDYEERHAS
eukprot:TRINITY_DN9170_c0_g1_i2.p1 TRINITY_DN9170_c0_g1~~TRINITY_DN9170_c0_g1_i2.p1  ORF type:complete len:330 (+),score=89.95 TRINITY_DN9170_c0_g1_i2:57-1046(+)